MPRIPSISPATGAEVPPYFIHTAHSHFIDNTGRTLLLRGVNLSSSSKAPVNKPTYVLDGFWETAENGGESFVGRPLNIDDGSADVHLARLRGWGFNMLRYIITWEALEHEGPGKYDYEFMDYTVRVLRKCKEYGFKVYMDPHQDVWSRFSGGSGAPFWTIPACGINPRNFTATQAAILHPEYPSPSDPNPASLPAMSWSTNYGRLASQTIFTLFFAGRDYAPKCVIDGQNIQDYLQGHYVEAFGRLADRIREAGDLYEECVIGWDSMNEPFEGLLGWQDLNKSSMRQTGMLKKGSAPTPAQSLRLGMGQAQTVEHWQFGSFGPKKDGMVTIDPKGATMWSDPSTEPEGVHPKWGWKRDPGWELGTCVWAQHDVWDIETGEVIKQDYFYELPHEDRKVEFIADYWRPHWQAYIRRIRQAHPEAILFVEPPVFAPPPPIEEDDLRGRCCYSPHYYDGLTLVTRHWNWFNADALGVLRGKYSSPLLAVKVGEPAIRKSLQEQLTALRDDAVILGSYPTIIGEIGIPYDMDNKKSYGWTDNGKYLGDYTNQRKALDASMNAADGPNALNYTIWCYSPDSCHEWGDGWNMEDLSLWSADDSREKGKEGLRMGSSKSGAQWKETPADSSVSLSTVTGTGSVAGSTNTAVSTAGWENQYAFLTDGARAVRAFARPYPVATIGTPKHIEFDLAKAQFKLTVLVRPEDAPRISPPAEAIKEVSALPTEIYVPLVHYAAERLVAKATGQETGESSASDSADSSIGSSTTDSPTITGSPAGESPVLSSLTAPSPLALNVTTSAGRWEVEGQTLKWWYPVPTDAEKEYTIQITRLGGPIKLYEEVESNGGLLDWVCGLFCPGARCRIM